MTAPVRILAAALLAVFLIARPAPAQTVYPVAILGFEERGIGAKDYGPKVADLLFASLVVNPDLYLVDRADMAKTLSEQSLNLSGAVKADEAAQVGQLTGAKILITGSVIQVDKKLILVAKVIGTETTRVLGASANGNLGDDLGPIVDALAEGVSGVITKQADKLVPKPVAPADRVKAITAKLGADKPVVTVKIGERHIGAPAVDPAAETEVVRLAEAVGFEVIDPSVGATDRADVAITGEAFSEVAGRVGGLVSVKARVEVKAVDRKTGKVLASDRQTAVVVDLAEQIAGKAALEQAAGTLAERVLPKLTSDMNK